MYAVAARTIWRRLLAQAVVCAALRADERTGKRIAMRIAMIAITTRSSTSVKARRWRMGSPAANEKHRQAGERQERRFGRVDAVDDGDGVDVGAADARARGVIDRLLERI